MITTSVDTEGHAANTRPKVFAIEGVTFSRSGAGTITPLIDRHSNATAPSFTDARGQSPD
ncbi:MAG TPA: hypothetical protein DDZ51_04935 [Planctomycetaceae bacterium]|nr:hypothetical protein [Planctomycetaceae bacterium]